MSSNFVYLSNFLATYNLVMARLSNV
uniref:Uncharacterized protein n=1 Tax=Arundo donax TaxID=35708 RepID=A0A0A9GNQ3_ARUDO